jgi:hypothetical protein
MCDEEGKNAILLTIILQLEYASYCVIVARILE